MKSCEGARPGLNDEGPADWVCYLNEAGNVKGQTRKGDTDTSAVSQLIVQV